MFIAEIIPTANGDVWLITEENGVICVSEINHGQLRIVKGTEIPNLKDNVNFVFEDHQGRVWFGTTDGLRCLIKKHDTYVTHLSSAISFSGITLNLITPAVDKKGRMLF